MPWTDENLEDLTMRGRNLIQKQFGCQPDAPIFYCTLEELIARLTSELKTRGLTVPVIEALTEQILPLTMGKYFGDTREIWIVNGIEGVYSTIIHELLHSI
jgi:hypothetical protein